MDSTNNHPKTPTEHFNSAAAHYEKSTGGCTRELARILLELPQLADVGFPDSVVLDNACGTGIVAEEIIERYCTEERTSTTASTIHIVDAASNMVDIARSKLETVNEKHGFRILGHVMPGEHLAIEDETFTHSITNLGILFFTNGVTGAKEIYRTLRVGGTAVVTSWSDLGYMEPIIKPAQLETRPGEQPYQLPISADWFSKSHMRNVLLQGGFEDITISEVKVHYGAATVDEVSTLLMESFSMIWNKWSVREKAQFRALVKHKTTSTVEQYVMPNGEKGFGLPMKAFVAVCRKSDR